MIFFDSFIPQLLATLVGGAIGVFGVWWAFRLQRKAAARDGVEHAAENLLLRLAEYVGLVDAYMKEFDMTQWHVQGAKMQRAHRGCPLAVRHAGRAPAETPCRNPLRRNRPPNV